MRLPFHVSYREPSASLFELSDGRFQKMEAGALAPWCQGYGYLLVERTLADFLKALKSRECDSSPPSSSIRRPTKKIDRSFAFASASTSRQIRSATCRSMAIGC
jgi:hypothetical protein